MTELGQALQVWRSGAGSPAWNMAADELLLRQAAALGQAVLRFYAWNQPAATFGYFQRHAGVSKMTRLRPLVRRPTAGGLVCHDQNEWTYSLIFPPPHPWWRFKAEESYNCVHEWVRRAFESCGVAVELCVEARSVGEGQCFVGAEKCDLLFSGKKIAGAAQRRNRDGLLVQGSVQAEATGVARAEWESAMLEEADWREWQVPDPFTGAATDLAKQKYATEEYNQKR